MTVDIKNYPKVYKKRDEGFKIMVSDDISQDGVVAVDQSNRQITVYSDSEQEIPKIMNFVEKQVKFLVPVKKTKNKVEVIYNTKDTPT